MMEFTWVERSFVFIVAIESTCAKLMRTGNVGPYKVTGAHRGFTASACRDLSAH